MQTLGNNVEGFLVTFKTCNMLLQPDVALNVALCAMLHVIDF